MRFIRLSEYYAHYSSLIARPSIFHLLLLGPNMIMRGPVKSVKDFLRFVKANRLPDSVSHRNLDLPEIQLMICVIQKDFHLLERCIKQAIKHSANPVKSVNIILPGRQIEACTTLISGFIDSLPAEVHIIKEESLISAEKRELLEQSLGSSYGWGLQQFLTVAFVIQSKYRGVLTVNADTIILRKRNWLNIDGTQELLVSSEYHKPYYEVLERINSDLSRIQYTFVCHQMLFQPNLLRKYLAKIGVEKIEDFVDIVLSNSDCTVRSPFCIEFEFYGQNLYNYNRELVSLVRFGNVTYKFDQNESVALSQLDALELKPVFNSVSQHSWL